MNEKEFIRIIAGAMRELSEQHLPPEINLSTVRDAVETFKTSYFIKSLEPYTSIKQLREEIPYCFSCFRTTATEAAHIVTRGASVRMRDSVDNIMMLCRDCHNFQHQQGLSTFLETFPHLYPRGHRAYELFYKGETDG